MAEISQFSTGQLIELFALVLLLNGEEDPTLFERLGLDVPALEDQLARGGPVADAARLIQLSGHVGSRRILALLVRGALVDQLSTVEKASELRDLATATSRLPEWVFELVNLTPAGEQVLSPTATRGSTRDAIRSAAGNGAQPAPRDAAGAPEAVEPVWRNERGETANEAMARIQRELDAQYGAANVDPPPGTDAAATPSAVLGPACRDGPAHFESG